MSRTMPTQCEHGEIVDWGDFGPCQGDCDHEGDCPNFPDCPDCMETRMTPEQTTAIHLHDDPAFRLRIHAEAIEDGTPVPYGKMAEVQRLAITEIEALRAVVAAVFEDDDGTLLAEVGSASVLFPFTDEQNAAIRRALQNGRSATPEPTRPDPSLTERQLWGDGSTDA